MGQLYCLIFHLKRKTLNLVHNNINICSWRKKIGIKVHSLHNQKFFLPFYNNLQNPKYLLIILSTFRPYHSSLYSFTFSQNKHPLRTQFSQKFTNLSNPITFILFFSFIQTTPFHSFLMIFFLL